MGEVGSICEIWSSVKECCEYEFRLRQHLSVGKGSLLSDKFSVWKRRQQALLRSAIGCGMVQGWLRGQALCRRTQRQLELAPSRRHLCHSEVQHLQQLSTRAVNALLCARRKPRSELVMDCLPTHRRRGQGQNRLRRFHCVEESPDGEKSRDDKTNRDKVAQARDACKTPGIRSDSCRLA